MEDDTNLPEGRLLKIYPPENAEDNTSVDIVAIHGLGTTTPRTWEYKAKTRVVNWLSDSNMLPGVVPSARIYTFSWNAMYDKDASVARIKDVANVLLSNLQNRRDKEDTHSRPLIFVASCFGGLIVTKALEIANIHDSQFRNLLVATSGVVFLGSPLQGTTAAKAAQWKAMISSLLGQNPSQTLLEDLDGSTRALRATSENFVRMVTTPPMRTMTMCFWESRKTQILKAVLPKWTSSSFGSSRMIIVEEDSACLFGRPKQLLDAPHSMMNKFFGPDDANFGLVSNAIKEVVERAYDIAGGQREAKYLHNEHFIISRLPNPLFSGREEELKRLKQALCPSLSMSSQSIEPKIYVISGMGGAGKSEIAVKFAHENRTKFWGIFWIDARSKDSITKSCAIIARTCGCHDDSIDSVKIWLQNTAHSWLLILDNADTPDLDLAPYFPAGRNGSILITTRLNECTNHQTVGEDHFERLDEKTAIDLLLKACHIGRGSRSDREDHARAITETLGCHALAIVQAGSAISQGLCSLGDYKEAFRMQRQDLLDVYPKQAKSEYGGVYATFEVSAKYLKARGKQVDEDALQLLSFYAFMHYSDLPEAVFEEAWNNSSKGNVVSTSLSPNSEESIRKLAPWHVSHLPSFRRKSTYNMSLDTLRLRKARSLLASLSLVTFDPSTGMTRMHPVSHFWSRDRLRGSEESANFRLSGLCVLSLSIREPFNIDVSVLTRQLQSHIEFFADTLKEWDYTQHGFHVQQSVYRLCWIMCNLRSGSTVLEMLRMIPLFTDEPWRGALNGQRIQLLHAQSECKFGDASKAVLLLEQMIETKSRSSAKEGPNLLDLQHNLAVAYLEIDDTTKGTTLLEQMVHTRKETLNPEHPDRLASEHELAGAYMHIEETDKAVALLEETVQLYTKTRNPEHPDLLTSQHELARAYLQKGETEKAISLLEPVVEIRAKTLRVDHSDLLTSQQVLAQAYLQKGETQEAISLLEPVVEIRAKTLRADHPSRVRSIYTLARCHYRVRNYDRALELARSIEGVARNRRGEEIADWNAKLIGGILKDMEKV